MTVSENFRSVGPYANPCGVHGTAQRRESSRLGRIAVPCLMVFVAGCAQETIAHQQVEREANRMLVLLMKSGVEAEKLKDEDARDLVFNILVPKEDAGNALAILEAADLPKTDRIDTAAMFEDSGLIPTTEQERAKRVVGVEGDIVNALRKVPRVISVEAAVSIPAEDPLRDVTEERPKPKASVIIIYKADSTGTPPMGPAEVQKFVQAKLPELRSASVNVLLIPSKKLGGGGGGGEAGATGIAPIVDPSRGCVDKERVIGIDVCKGNKSKVLRLVIVAGIVAIVLALLVVLAVLRAMGYRKDLTRLTAQFQARSGK